MTAPVYGLFGEGLLADEALERVRAEVGADALSEDAFGPQSSAAEIAAALETPSLLGGRRLVVVHDAHDLRKDQVQAIERYLESPSPHAVLVLVAGGRSPLAARVKEVGTVISLDAPRGKRLAAWARQRASDKGLDLDDRGAWTLLDAIGTELRDVDAALEQLSARLGRGAKAGPAEVRSAFPRLADENIWAFTDAVGDRRLPVAVGTLRRLLDQGEEPLVLFGALVAQVRRMVTARAYASAGARAVAQALGLPEWRADKLSRQVRSYREDELVAAMAVLAAADVEMKGGDLPPHIALERAVLTIVSGEGSDLRRK